MKITMLGKAEGWKQATRDNSYPGEVWGLNNLIFQRNLDKIFDVHHRKIWDMLTSTRKQRYTEILKKSDVPFITLDRDEWPELPKAETFPIWKFEPYFNSSFDFMLAYAIEYGATDIHIRGCKVVEGGSHEFARPSIEYWIKGCLCAGINVTVYPPSDIMKLRKNQVYGYWVSPEEVSQIRPKAPALDCH